MRRTVFLSMVAMLLAAGSLSAQAGRISGTVRAQDDGRPIPGATITVIQTMARAVAGDDGTYVITGVAPGVYDVTAEAVGFATATRSVTIGAGATATTDFRLQPQAMQLEQLVVVGYGTTRAKDLSVSVQQVSPEEFNKGRIVSPEQLIQSKVPGVQVVDNNEPGGGISVRIRGATSINASSDPLFVIDGMPVGSGSGGGLSAGRNPLNFLNPEDIESITVLKDAAAAAIYGANAANGVVMITTKKGKTGTQIEYTGSVSASTVTKLPDMLNAAQYRAAVQQYAPGNVSQLGNANTDWFGLVDRTALGQEHNLALSNANEVMNYRLSLGYLNQDGVIDGTTTERISAGLNYGQRFFDNTLEINASLKGSRNFDRFTPGGVLSNAAQMGPTQPVMDANNPAGTGYFEWPGSADPPDYKDIQSADNPVAILALASDEGTTYRSIGNVQGAYSLPFLQGLKANVNLGYDVTKSQRKTFSPSDLHSQLKAGTGGTYYSNNQTLTNTALDAYLNYAGALGSLPGNIDVTGGYSYSQSNGEYPWLQEQGLSTNLLGPNGIPGATTVTNFLDIQDSKLISVFGRLNYSLMDRYLASVSVRRDGSSRFGTHNAWGTFPSVALAWRLSDEPFLRENGLFSDLKLRGSWGKTGNQAFDNYQQYTTYLVGNAQAQYQFGNEWVTTIRPSAADPNIRWESTESWDVGLDYGILGQRFSGSFDWYVKDTKDLIFTVPIAAGTNLSNYLTTNIGSMKNRGIEMSLSARILEPGQEGGLSWTAEFNASHNKNELTSINPFAGQAQQILTGRVAGGVGTDIQVLQPGVPIHSFYVYEHKLENGKPIYEDTNGDNTINEQDLYVDLNGDNKIDNNDLRPFHDPAPKWILGHTSTMGYGAFDLGFTLRAYIGNYVYNNVASNLGTYSEVTRGSPYNLHALVLETGFETPQYFSDWYVEDASFLRMDNITLGYTLNYRGRPMRLFGTVQSVFTLTGYSGVDPTAGLNGIDNNLYPRSRTFTGGLSVRF